MTIISNYIKKIHINLSDATTVLINIVWTVTKFSLMTVKIASAVINVPSGFTLTVLV